MVLSVVNGFGVVGVGGGSHRDAGRGASVVGSPLDELHEVFRGSSTHVGTSEVESTGSTSVAELGVHLGWQRAHEQLVMLSARRAGLDFEEGHWLLRAYREAAHARLGYGSFVEYAERLFGYRPRLTLEKLRVAEALEGLPISARALQTGELSFSAVREVSRVATAETEKEWLEAARGKTVREVEQLVSGQRPGNRPGDLPVVGAKRHVLRFDVSGEVLATFREAMAKIRRDAGALGADAAPASASVESGASASGAGAFGAGASGAGASGAGASGAGASGAGSSGAGSSGAGSSGAGASGAGASAASEFGDSASCSDDAVLLLMARQILGGPKDAGRASYQVAVTVCERCERGFLQGVGDAVEVAPDVVEMACCDGQQIGRLEACRSHAHVGVSGTAVRGVDVAGARIQTEAHVGAGDAHAAGARRARATQPIPPAIRRAVLRRDGGRCRVPGCRHATFVDVHHLELRANGGSNDVENLITLCSAHHRASHNGELLTAGTTATAVSFAHADGTPYRRVPMPAVAEVRAKAFRALVLMGFHEKEAKGALARVPADPELDLERVVRKALQLVGQP